VDVSTYGLISTLHRPSQVEDLYRMLLWSPLNDKSYLPTSWKKYRSLFFYGFRWYHWSL